MKINITGILLLAAATLLAQGGPRGQQNGGSPGNPVTAPDMAKLQTLTGTVSAVNLGYGMQYPSITVNQAQIKVAPLWYLLDKNFELKAGDAVSVVAAPSTVSDNNYLYAIEITNTATRARVVLRDSSGAPVWTGPQRGRGNSDAPRNGTGCVEAGSILTATGVIENLTMGVGIQMPTMVLKTDGKLISIKLGPERILLEADLELRVGQTVTVRYARPADMDEYIALQIISGGATVTLRHDDGTPNWN